MKFDVGVMWEENPWEIRLDEKIEYGAGPCPHVYGREMVKHERYDGSYYEVDTWTCPRVVVVVNEGGCNSTGLCLDCLIEAVNKLKGEESPFRRKP